jgi:hypothetical protein
MIMAEQVHLCGQLHPGGGCGNVPVVSSREALCEFDANAPDAAPPQLIDGRIELRLGEGGGRDGHAI